MIYLSYGLAALAIVVMAIDVVLALRLKRAILGGEVAEKWGLLTTLIVVFFVGYLFSPLLLYFDMPKEYFGVVAFAVFVFGAIFVWVVIGIIRDALSFLDLLKTD